MLRFDVPGGEVILWPDRCIRCGAAVEAALTIDCSFGITLIGLGTVGRSLELRAPGCERCARLHGVFGPVFHGVVVFAAVAAIIVGGVAAGGVVGFELATGVGLVALVLAVLGIGLLVGRVFDRIFLGTWAGLHPIRHSYFVASRDPAMVGHLAREREIASRRSTPCLRDPRRSPSRG